MHKIYVYDNRKFTFDDINSKFRSVYANENLNVTLQDETINIFIFLLTKN